VEATIGLSSFSRLLGRRGSAAWTALSILRRMTCRAERAAASWRRRWSDLDKATAYHRRGSFVRETLAVLDHAVYDQLDHLINVPEVLLAGVAPRRGAPLFQTGQDAGQLFVHHHCEGIVFQDGEFVMAQPCRALTAASIRRRTAGRSIAALPSSHAHKAAGPSIRHATPSVGQLDSNSHPPTRIRDWAPPAHSLRRWARAAARKPLPERALRIRRQRKSADRRTPRRRPETQERAICFS